MINVSAEGFEPSLKVPKTFVLTSTLRTEKIPYSHEQGIYLSKNINYVPSMKEFFIKTLQCTEN